MFFDSVEIIRPPVSREKIIFQCDRNYFEKFALYNLMSCVKHKMDVHIHFMNPDDKLLEDILKLNLPIDLSVSKEFIETDINFYKLKSYYFCSRYFIANYLFENFNLESAYITDADLVFNKKIDIGSVIDLGVLYFPNQNNLWKQSGANFLLVRKNRSYFLKKITNLYNKKIQEIDFAQITHDMDKIQRSNFYGLDQVCISSIIKEENSFFNLCSFDKFISKTDTADSTIWTFTGNGTKLNSELQVYLKEKFNDELRFFQFESIHI